MHIVKPERAQRVAVCVCTRSRPKMLERCLDSLGAQLTDGSIAVSIIIVSNGPGHFLETRAVAERFERVAPFPVHFTHQDEAGIAAARNTACGMALLDNAAWIAFIDDDEAADPDWIANLMAPDYRHVPILAGANITEFPDAIPEWLRPRCRLRPEGCETVTGAGNIRIAATVFDTLRFNEAIGLGGGEDGEFLLAARKAGFEMRHTARAITREVAHPERYTPRGIIARSYWIAAANMREEMLKEGRWRAIRRRLPAIVFAALVATGQLAIGAGRFLHNRNSGRRKMLGAGKGMAVAAGRSVAILGHIPQPYRIIDGE